MQRYKGRIFTGIGVAKTRVGQNIDVYRQVTRMEIVPGTLNVRLTDNFKLPEDSIHIPPEMIQPFEKKRGITLVFAQLHSSTVVIMVPDPPFYDANVIEVMAPFNIRQQFNLEDGDEIEIVV
ncbi:MAG: DUF120 domain-containing protein [Chloroflexi bacterium]|nr:DUF120 domain-containing protein [Chloroflexota bacterium]